MQGLPAEFDHHLQYAVANRVCSVPEIGVCKSPATVKREFQVLVAIEERAIRVVQEVIAREAELKLFVLRSEEHTSELQSRLHLVCRLLLEKKKKYQSTTTRFDWVMITQSSVPFTLVHVTLLLTESYATRLWSTAY